MKIRALTADIYKPIYGDCSNGGISSRFDEVFVECQNGPHVLDRNDLPDNFVVAEKNRFGHVSFRPWAKKEPGNVGWFAGGCFVYASDSRFPFDYPVALHDRQESQQLYNQLSM